MKTFFQKIATKFSQSDASGAVESGAPIDLSIIVYLSKESEKYFSDGAPIRIPHSPLTREIIFVEDGASPNLRKPLAAASKNLRDSGIGIRFEGSLHDGRRMAYMHASGTARGRYLMIVDQFSSLDWRWVQEAFENLEVDSEIAIVRGGTGLKPALFLIRAEVWRALDGFETEFFSWAKLREADLDLRIQSLGFKVGVSAVAGGEDSVRSASKKNDAELEAQARFAARWDGWHDPRTARDEAAIRAPGSGCVYTAIVGAYDVLKAVPEAAKKDINFIALLDAASTADAPPESGWEVRPLTVSEGEPARTTRRAKVLSHLSFPDQDWSLWIDGSISILHPFPSERLVELYLADRDMCVLKHAKRDCIYQEAQVCRERNLDQAELIDRQMERYRAEKYPERAGLVETTVVLRRHTAAIREFNEAWWYEIEHGSKRDQLSFNYVAAKLRLRYNIFPLDIHARNGLFFRNEHRRK